MHVPVCGYLDYLKRKHEKEAEMDSSGRSDRSGSSGRSGRSGRSEGEMSESSGRLDSPSETKRELFKTKILD